MNDQTLGLLIVLFLAFLILGQKKRTRYIPAKSKRLAWAKFYQDFYGNPANRGKKLRKKDYEFDHIIPFSKGGTNDPDNIRVLLKKENRRKGASSDRAR